MIKHALLAVAVFSTLVFRTVDAAPSSYHVTDLGALSSPFDSSASWGVNSLGQVVGYVGPFNNSRAFFWDSDLGMIDFAGQLGTSAATSINSSGLVVGWSSRAFQWSTSDGMTLLPILPGHISSSAYDVNEVAQIVGKSGPHAALWSGGSLADLGDLPGGSSASEALAINNNGDVVGDSNVAGAVHAFLWKNGTGMIDLSSLRGATGSSNAYDINDHGQIVGDSETQTGRRAVLWENGNILDLGSLPGGNQTSNASGINKDGVVIGTSRNAFGPRAIIWTATDGMLDLNQFLDPSSSSWLLQTAADINDAGQIVGTGFNPDGAFHAFLLTPVPESSAIALATCGVATAALAGLHCRRRAKV